MRPGAAMINGIALCVVFHRCLPPVHRLRRRWAADGPRWAAGGYARWVRTNVCLVEQEDESERSESAESPVLTICHESTCK